ncbi:MAG: hypothetical protein ABR613_13275 [Actinomycetota bacterium]
MRRLLFGLLVLLVGCAGNVEPGASSSAAPSSSGATAQATDEPPEDPCAQYPPPFEASYLPEGFKKKLRNGAGLFKGAEGAGAGYPTKGLLGHYRGPVETVHVNFETRPGPLPYEPANPHLLRGVVGGRGRIGKIEGGWSVEFSLDDCDFRMDAYGIDRAGTVKVAKGLRQKD